MKTEEQKNVFAELQKNRKPRRKGLLTPPKVEGSSTNISLPEKSEAVPANLQPLRRSYRVSTFISEKAGEQLDQAILKIKHLEGKKPKIAEALERAIHQLTFNLDN